MLETDHGTDQFLVTSVSVHDSFCDRHEKLELMQARLCLNTLLLLATAWSIC